MNKAMKFEKLWHLFPDIRYIVRDPEIFEPISEGEKGLMTVYDPSMNCYPAFIISNDFVKVSDIKNCECGAVTQNLIKFEERTPDADLDAYIAGAKVMKKNGKIKMQLPIIVEMDEDGYYIVSCPLFKGCHSYGKTMMNL